MDGLLRGSPESRIAFSTRSLAKAAKIGPHVNVDARDPCGPLSMVIFMANAAQEENHSDRIREATLVILELCAGLPIALSVAGAAVFVHTKSGLDFESACRFYLDEV